MTYMKQTPALKNPFIVTQVHEDGTIGMMHAVSNIDDAIYFADEHRVALKPAYQHQIAIFQLVETV
jgi:hypothetical protein